MAYSTIKRKMCKCGCGKPPTLSYNGWNYFCAPDEIKEKVQSQKKETAKKRNQRIASKLKALPENIEMADKHIRQNEWYINQRGRMVGRCCNCGKSSPKNNDKYFKWGIMHILPKSLFPSVAMDDDNWVEGCILCHTEFDKSLEGASKMPMFKLAVAKYEKFKNKILETHKFKNIFEEYAIQLKINQSKY